MVSGKCELAQLPATCLIEAGQTKPTIATPMANIAKLKQLIATKEKQRAKLAGQLVAIDGQLEGLRKALSLIEGADATNQ